MKKNKWAKLGAAVLGALLLAGCGNVDGNNADSQGLKQNTKAEGDSAYSVVCTIYPQYDWVKEIVGEQAESFELTLLLDNGVDLHSYQPTADDIIKISTADLFVYVGGESDEWVEDVLETAHNKDMKVINLLETIGDNAKEEEMKEGMQEEEHDHDRDGDLDDRDGDREGQNVDKEEQDGDPGEHDHDDEEIEYDEHVWLSLNNAMATVNTLSDAICAIDETNAQIYQSNAQNYIAKLKDLDAQYADVVKNAKKKTILFGDRFPFRYMVDDYNLDYYAAFVGCSAETEASFETVSFLAGKLDELELKAILVIESSDQKIAEAIRQASKTKDQEILVLNSLQSVTAKDINEGATYLGVMEENLETLRKALN